MCRIGYVEGWWSTSPSAIKDSGTPSFERSAMDVQGLRYALTLAEELNFGRAAAVHYIAAQPFGRRIQRLERDLGVRLFDRSSHHVALTPAGERFLPRARRVLADFEGLMRLADDHPGDRILRVGVLGFGLADRWPVIRGLLARHRPDLALSYVELTWEDQYDAVRYGEVDVAVVHDVGGADDLVVDRVMDTLRYAVVPAESDLADADRLTVGEIGDRPWVAPTGQPGLVDWIGEDVSLGVAVRSPAATPAAVVTTGMVGVHAEPAIRYLPHPGVRYVRLDGAPAVVAVASRRDDHRENISAFRAAVSASTQMAELGTP
jgi:DNA-binding transcriptional LysR family regulator